MKVKKIPKDRLGEPTTPPDIDKLIRAGLDALTAVAYRDDAQVTFVRAWKRYCGWGVPGVMVPILDDENRKLVPAATFGSFSGSEAEPKR